MCKKGASVVVLHLSGGRLRAWRGTPGEHPSGQTSGRDMCQRAASWLSCSRGLSMREGTVDE